MVKMVFVQTSSRKQVFKFLHVLGNQACVEHQIRYSLQAMAQYPHSFLSMDLLIKAFALLKLVRLVTLSLSPT